MSLTDLVTATGNPFEIQDAICGGVSVTTTSGTTFTPNSAAVVVGQLVSVTGIIDFTQTHGATICPHAFTDALTVMAIISATPSPGPTQSPVAGAPCYTTVSNTQEWPANCLLYAANSPWNRPITNPDSPILFPNSATIMSTMLANIYAPGGINTLFIPGGPGVPSPYISSTSDPLVTYSCNLYCGGSQLSSGAQFRVPPDTTAIGTGDAVMAVIQPNGDEVDCWETPQGTWTTGNTFAAGSCTLFPNAPTNSGWLPGATADDTIRGDITLGSASTSGIAVGESFIRASELQAGVINHALGMDIFCESGTVYPATHYDNQCPFSGGIPAGARVWSDLTDAQVNGNANLTPDDKTILIALHHYGAYIRDSNANSPTPPGHVSLYLDQGGTVGASETPMYVLGQSRSAQVLYSNAGEWQHITSTSPDRYIFGDPWLPNVSGGILSHLHIVDTCYAAGTC